MSPALSGAADSDHETLLQCFAQILRLSPTSAIWTFDTSPELPHTIFSEIKDNPAFLKLLDSRYSQDSSPTIADERKGKGKQSDQQGPLSWITDFLVSLTSSTASTKESAFPETLAKAMHFCFAEMQHERLSQRLRAAAADVGFKVRAKRATNLTVVLYHSQTICSRRQYSPVHGSDINLGRTR